MKTILTFALLLVMTSIATAQTKVIVNKTKAVETKTVVKSGEAAYLVGSDNFPGYKIEIKSCPTKGQVVLSNGRKAPALNCFIVDKNEYIGGKLVFGKKTTKIVDIKIESLGDENATFTVIGKGFDMSFTLLDGMILRINGEEVIFHTKEKGIWKIIKV